MRLKNPVLKKYGFFPHYLFLFFVTLFVRFPFFFRDYIDRDESTFILIGKSITDGHLPYDFLWDLKPPLLFYIFGLVEYIFPHSLIAIRFFGVLIIFLSAVFLVQIARIAGIKNGFLIALSYILLSSLFGSIQGVMSEHLAVFFILPGLIFFLKNKTPANLFLAGILFSCAMLCKINYAYAILALLIYYFISNIKLQGFPTLAKNIFLIIIGIAIPFFLISIPFIVKQKLTLFINSVFMATLEYGHTMQYTILQKLATALWIILLGLAISFLALRSSKNENRNFTWVCVSILLGTIFSFYSSGSINGHYYIRVFPFISLLVLGIIIKKEFNPGFAGLSLFVLLISIESIIEYYRLANHYAQNSRLYNGNTFRVINELKSRQLDNKKIFFADYHIGYWFLHQYPLTKSTTHPSSLSRPFFFKHFGNYRSSLEELKYIMDTIKPEIVVSRNSRLDFFPEKSYENLYFDSTIANHFNIIYKKPDKHIFIWQRKEY